MTMEWVMHAVRRVLRASFRRPARPRYLMWRRLSGLGQIGRGERIDVAGRAALLIRVCVCVRLKQLDEAQQILNGSGFEQSDAARLNLLGVLCELRGQWRKARRFYGRAIRADRRFEPPQQNIRRLYELSTLGRSDIALALGDEDPQVWAQRDRLIRRLEVKAHSRAAHHYHDN